MPSTVNCEIISSSPDTKSVELRLTVPGVAYSLLVGIKGAASSEQFGGENILLVDEQNPMDWCRAVLSLPLEIVLPLLTLQENFQKKP